MTDLEEIALYEQLLEEERKKPLDYFKHDSNAHDDNALAALTFEYGMAYYGMYWLLIEHLAERKTHMYDTQNSLDRYRLMQDMTALAPIPEHEIEQFIELLARNNLINKEIYYESGKIIVDRILKNVDVTANMQAKRRVAGIRGSTPRSTPKSTLGSKTG